MTTLYDFEVQANDGSTCSLERYRGKALLIVNVASRCGFTPQYAGLETLYRALAPRGFEVLGFPCNQFGGQEPGSAQEIRGFCTSQYAVSFPLFAKIEVNGSAALPLYRWLKQSAKGLLGTEAIKWNFTKFLIDRSGNVVRRYGPRTTPETIQPDVERLL